MVFSILIDTNSIKSTEPDAVQFEVARILEEIANDIHDDGDLVQKEIYDLDNNFIGAITLIK